MNLSRTDLYSLYNIVRDRYNDIICGDWNSVKEEISELHLLMYKLLKLQEGVAENVPAIKVSPSGKFDFSTAETAKKLKVTDSGLRALRNAKELKEGWHYITGRSPRPTAIWYDIHQTCIQVHGITWHDFSSPGFDFKAHTERRTAQAFEAARRRQKT